MYACYIFDFYDYVQINYRRQHPDFIETFAC